MRLAHVDIENFRGLRSLSLHLSSFSCIVGHNNAGKSSLLTALSLFVHGTKIGKSDFYDENQNVLIRVTLDGVTPEALSYLSAEHRPRVAELVWDGKIVLVRRYSTDGSTSMRCMRLVPRDARLRDEGIDDALAGKRGAGQLREATLHAYPELEGRLEGVTAKGAFVELIQSLRQGLAGEQMALEEAPLPTGIDNSVTKLLPEPILIPAVKDVSDEVKTKEAASFGKILRIMLDSIGDAECVQQVTESFKDLQALLNVTRTAEGGAKDDRLEEVKALEGKVSGYVREQFPNVQLQLEIPPPDLKAVVAGARIHLHNGVWGQVESKGDGMKRAVTFALLRSIADMRRGRAAAGVRDGQSSVPRQRYLFLFEEPELYLHPQAQRVLYNALVDISEEHQVCVSTHSPFFFSPRGTGTFIRLGKRHGGIGEAAPASQARYINLLDNMSCKDAFQIICYENNAAAFFCDRVVLVEGDSDLLYLKHVAKTLNPDWDFDARNIAVVRINGKGNFKRFRGFFDHFGVSVSLIADLDAVVDQFGGLGELDACSAERDALIKQIDVILETMTSTAGLNSEKLRRVTDTRNFQQKFEDALAIIRRVRDGGTPTQGDLVTLDDLLAAGKTQQRCFVLKRNPELAEAKEALLHALRGHGVHVLSCGCLEDYYPEAVRGHDKPTKALHALEVVKTREHALARCPQIADGSGARRHEFELIFEAVFRA